MENDNGTNQLNILDFLVNVLFYENDLLGEPLFITTLITPPRLGESVAFPQPGQQFSFVGRVVIVGWGFEEGEWYCTVILERI